MQVEIFGGKRYVFVCVDDLSRHTRINFIKEKSDMCDVYKMVEYCVQQMQYEFEMSIEESFAYFLGLQAKQLSDTCTKALNVVQVEKLRVLLVFACVKSYGNWYKRGVQE